MDTRVKARLETLIFLTLLMSDLACAQCPLHCSCSAYSNGQTVSCGPGITSFPTPVPTDTLIFSISALPGQAQNNIASLSQNDFSTFTLVKRIRIAFSNLQLINVDTFAKLSNLQSLDIKGNRLANVSKAMFQGLNKLELLDLSDNLGCSIGSDTFDDLLQLKIIRLAGIGLTSVGNVFSKLKSLQTCDLHGNKLVRLDSGSFAHLSNLRHLDVSFNNLREIQPGMKAVLSGLSSLKLDYNPWRCNCALNWTKTLPAKFVQPSFGHGGGIICDQPKRLQFRDLRNVKDAEMTCIPARIDTCSNKVMVKEGDSVNVTCKVMGDPFPDVVWKKPDLTQYRHTLQANVTSQTTISLPFTDFANHNGRWTVEVYNTNGSDSKRIEIDVITTTTTTTTTSPPTTTTTTETTSQQTTTPTVPSSPLSSSPTSQANSHNSVTTKLSPNHLPGSKISSAPGSTGIQQSSFPSTTPSTSLPSNINIVLVVAASAGGLVCFTGFVIFILVIYKTKRKSRIAAKRRSVYSTAGEFQMFTRQPTKMNGSFRFMD